MDDRLSWGTTHSMGRDNVKPPRSRGDRILVRARRAASVLLALVVIAGGLLVSAPAEAVTTGNGALVFSPAAGSSFDPEGTHPVGTTYAKIIVLKNSGASNGSQLVTFDQLVLVGGVQVYPIYRSTDNGTTWSHLTDISPSSTFPTLTRTAQPFLYELPQAEGTLPAGTILLSGMIMPSDRSSSRLVVYKSLDHGATWSFQSTIDTGGPATYDPSPTSTTTTVWEPSLTVDGNSGLTAYFSDERQKASGVLQAVVYRRSTDGGLTWGSLVNVSAPNNMSDRPGMITVSKMQDGRYIATYEVVNRPSQTLNTAQVYYKISADGLTWSPGTSIGTAIKLANGRGIGSSPFVRWVPTGGPEGMLIVSSKWSLDAAGNIDGGQNFYVNYNLGDGPWERMPFAVTYDASDTQGGAFSGFAQGFDVGTDGRTLYQATNVENLTTTLNDIRVGSIPLDAQQYEAERATNVDTSVVTHVQASNGSKVGNINNADSAVTFTVHVPAAGSYTANVRYDNGSGATSTHLVSVNGGSATSISYPVTRDWGRFAWVQKTVTLNAGTNTIKFAHSTGFAELDVLQLYRSIALDAQFRVVNRNSGLFLEIANALTTDGALADQWGNTSNPTQVWNIQTVTGGIQFTNVNSGKVLEIPGSSMTNGTQADQRTSAGTATQKWVPTTSGGWWQFTNLNSAKFLEVASASLTNGASVDQWANTSNNCQWWGLTKEGIQ